MISYRCAGYGKTKIINEPKRCFNIKKEVSVIIPTYNEEGNIERLVNLLKSELKDIDYEIVIVDDDSKDNTQSIIDNLAKRKGLIAVHRKNARGIFSAIKDGVKIANGDYIVVMDSDFSHPPSLIKEFWKNRNRYDIVSGSRFTKGGDMEAPISRKYGSLFINRICALILGVKQKDIAGGFHLMKKSKFMELNPKTDTVFGEFDFEIFYKAKLKNWRIKEIPFVYKFREEGSSKMGGSAPEIIGLLNYALIYFKKAVKLRFGSQL